MMPCLTEHRSYVSVRGDMGWGTDLAQHRVWRMSLVHGICSIKPNQVSLAFARLDLVGNLDRASLVVALRTDAHPMTRRAGELDHIRGTVLARELVAQLIRPLLILEGANLHAPPSAAVERRRSSKDLHPHPGHAGSPHPNRFGRCQR